MKEIQFFGFTGNTETGTWSIPIGHYPDGMPLVRHKDFPDRGVPLRMLIKPNTIGDLAEAMFFVDAMKERGQGVSTLVLPFVPGARQDRLNPDGDYLFTLKSVAQMINARGFGQVVVLDPHSEVATALIDRCVSVSAAKVLTRHLPTYAGIVSPDAGAEKRASAVAKKLGLPLFHGWKTRNVATGEITGFGCEPLLLPAGSRVLIVDDICDGGYTFLGLADHITDAAAQNGPRIKKDLYVTHGLFTKGTTDLRSRFENIFTTDSTSPEERYTPEAGLTIIPVCQQLLEGLSQ